MKYLKFEKEHISEATDIIVQRNIKQNQINHDLPKTTDNYSLIYSIVESIFNTHNADGIAVIDNKRLIGFMILIPEPHNSYWGRSLFFKSYGHGLVADANISLYRNMYAKLVEKWVLTGYYNHLLFCPSFNQDLLNTLYSLEFYQHSIFSSQYINKITISNISHKNCFEFRRATPDDLINILQISDLVYKHNMQTPVFAPFIRELDYNWSSLLCNEQNIIIIALKNKNIESFCLFTPIESDKTCINIDLMATKPDLQGTGLGSQLLKNTLELISKLKYDKCSISWRTANISASNFWLARNFKPISYRLHRQIDSRISWTYCTNSTNS